jgi:hypothetical protein
MQPYQQRVVTERDDLQAKIERLAEFLDTETYSTLPEPERLRLALQLRHMNSYREAR